jgi:hypothetical protein
MLCMLPWLSYATGSSGDAESEFKMTIIRLILYVAIIFWLVKSGRWEKLTSVRIRTRSKKDKSGKEND